MRFVHNSEKNKLLANEVFYGMIDSSALNAYLIFTHIVPVLGGKRPDKDSKFLEELAISLVVPHAKHRLVASQTLYCETNHSQQWNFTSTNSGCPKHEQTFCVCMKEVFSLFKIPEQKSFRFT